MVEDELNYASQLTARTDMTLHSALVSWLPGLNVKPFCLQVEGYTLGFCQGPELFYRIFTKTASIKADFFENKKIKIQDWHNSRSENLSVSFLPFYWHSKIF